MVQHDEPKQVALLTDANYFQVIRKSKKDLLRKSVVMEQVLSRLNVFKMEGKT